MFVPVDYEPSDVYIPSRHFALLTAVSVPNYKLSDTTSTQNSFFILTLAGTSSSGVPGGGVLPPPPKFRRPTKIVPNSNPIVKTVKNC